LKKILAVLAVVGLVASVSCFGAKEEPKTPDEDEATSRGAAQDVVLKDKKAKISYCLGISIGSDLKKQSIDIDLDVFAQGMKDILNEGELLMTDDEIRETMMAFQLEMMAKQQGRMQAQGKKNKEEGEAFLAANAEKEGVTVLPSGLQYEVLQAGDGEKPLSSDTVTFNYRGTLIDGTEFDNSDAHGGAQTMPADTVIAGWTEALQLMPVGSKWRLFIPSELAYSEGGAGPMVGPNSTLIFEVELVSIEPTEDEEEPGEAQE